MKEGEGIMEDTEHDLIHLFHSLNSIDLEYVKLHKKRKDIMDKIGAVLDKVVLDGRDQGRIDTKIGA